MSDNPKNIKFEDTTKWVSQEEKNRKNRGNGVSTFYLILASAIILGVVVFLLSMGGEDASELTALRLMQDPDNIFDDEYEDDGYSDNDEI